MPSADQRNREHADGDEFSFLSAIKDVVRIALPLMISAGTFSVVLFVDRTLLLWHDGESMSASMAAGNIFWVIVCLPVGIVSMTGAIIGQHIGAGESEKVGRLLWQAVWLSLMFTPLFIGVAWVAESIFVATGQTSDLVPLEATYLRYLMFAAVGVVIETALSGFFSGIERTRVVMWVSLASGVINFLLDWVLIFGFGPVPSMGIVGAAIGTAIAFWFKAICFACLILGRGYERKYRIRAGIGFHGPVFRNLLFFGLPTGLMYVSEAGGFAAIVLRIGRLGDIPLRATTMAINFNTIAFIPLVGVSIAASVLTGKHLLESGPARATRSAIAALLFALAYTSIWMAIYLLLPEQLMRLYSLQAQDAESMGAISIAVGLLKFVAIFLLLDTIQITLAGALRGAGDTWFVLFTGMTASLIAFGIGIIMEPADGALHWWWWIIAFWIGLLALAMSGRFIQGGWQTKRMV
ncbi:MAG: MATE family efflux transporter [Pirellulaceae bacterium]|nr:MATE family efflux transporter [Pirellulaceae bacterium]